MSESQTLDQGPLEFYAREIGRTSWAGLTALDKAHASQHWRLVSMQRWFTHEEAEAINPGGMEALQTGPTCWRLVSQQYWTTQAEAEAANPIPRRGDETPQPEPIRDRS